jgi:hypothetical protein
MADPEDAVGGCFVVVVLLLLLLLHAS